MKIADNRKRRGGIFIKNAAILTATSLLLKAAGMYFRIYVSDLIGAEGMGLYQLIMSVYVLLSGFASSGIVVAVTRMTSDEMVRGSVKTVRLVLRRCLTASVAMGLLSSVLAFSLSGLIGREWISDERAISSVKLMAFALPSMSISCCLRGYFTARRKVSVPSAAQIAEQGSRIVLALILLGKAAPQGVECSCTAIMIADVISEAAGCCCVVLGYLSDRRRLKCPDARRTVPDYPVWGRIWEIAAPVTASYYLTTLLRTVESILVPDCLTKFEQSRVRALELFGMVKGMALPLILFPSALLTAFASLLVPEISEASALGQSSRVETAVRRSMHITMTLAMLAGGLFAIYPYELGMLVYGEAELASVLRTLAPFMPLMYVESVAVGMLRGLGEQKSSLRYGLADSVIRIALIAVCVPRMGLNGFMVVMAVSNMLTPLLHIRRLLRVVKIPFEWSKWLLKPLASAVFACTLAKLTGRLLSAHLPMTIGLCLGGCVAAAVYCAMLWITRAVTRSELRGLLPSER